MKINNIFFLLILFFMSVFTNAQTPNNKIKDLFFQKEYTKALEIIEETETLSTEDFYYAGLSAETLEDVTLAAVYFQKSIDIDSDFIPAQIGLAQVLFQNDEYVNAMEIYAKLLETDSLNFFLWGALGDCYNKSGFYPLAYSCYRNSFYLNPKNSANCLKLITVLSILPGRDNVENSLSVCDSSLCLNPVDEALFYCDSSLYYNPNHKQLLRRKGSILFNNRYFVKAEDIFDQLLSMRDSSFQVLKQAGICKALFHKHDDAIHLLRKAYQQQPNELEVMLHFASSLSVKPQHFEEAAEVISNIFKSQQPDSAIIYQAHSLLAQSYTSIKDTVNAVLEYYRSIKTDNKDDRLLRMASLANHIKPETKQTVLWYVHYYFIQNFLPEYEQQWNLNQQKEFSQVLLAEYINYMHLSAQKKVVWKTLDGKTKTITMEDLRKMLK